MQNLETAYRLIAPDLTALEALTMKTLGNIDPFVEEVVRYSFQFGGKRLRPALLFLAGRATAQTTLDENEPLSERHCRAAAAIEFIHTASLIHDDILDGASLRRHLATLNVRWNAQVGILAGDWLLTRAMQFLLTDDDLFGFRRMNEACRKTCEGELRQIGTVGRFDMTEDEYFEMIDGKTAPLLACSTELGAYYSGADAKTVERFKNFGQKLGLAFQMIDDVLDLTGETDHAGKTLHTDLLNRKPTLPLILYLKNCSPGERNKTVQTLCSENFDEESARPIIERICATGAVDATRQKADSMIDEAIAMITTNRSNDRIAVALADLARFVGSRKI